MMRCVLLAALLAAAWASSSNDCGTPCDIMLVVDRSGSIKKFKDPSGSPTGGEKETDFVKDLVGMLNVHYNTAEFGLVSYSKTVKTDFATLGDAAYVDNGLDQMPNPGGVTHTHEAIAAGTEYLMTTGRGLPCKRMYVVTDGVTNPKSYAQATQDYAQAAKDQGVHIIAIGVGSGITSNPTAIAELQGIATDPDADNFIMAEDFAGLFDKLHQKDVCLPVEEPCTGLPSVHGGSGSWSCDKPYPPVATSGMYNHTSACTLTCPAGTMVQGDGQATCNNGTWAGNDDSCPSSPCTGVPPAVADGTWSCPDPMVHGDVCNLTCTFGLLKGDEIAECLSGTLTNRIEDACDSAACPSGTWSYQGSTYQFTTKKESWTQAAAEASNMGGYLASITSQAEQDFIKNTILDSSEQIRRHEYWIGLMAPQNTWTWSSGAPVSYTNFHSSQNPSTVTNHYGLMNELYVVTGLAVDLGLWSAEDNSIDPQCGLVELPPPVVCNCNTPPPPADPSQCAPAECSTLLSTNVYSFVMCKFDFPAEFGTWTETSPNNYVSNLNAGYTCTPAGSLGNQC